MGRRNLEMSRVDVEMGLLFLLNVKKILTGVKLHTYAFRHILSHWKQKSSKKVQKKISQAKKKQPSR